MRAADGVRCVAVGGASTHLDAENAVQILNANVRVFHTFALATDRGLVYDQLQLTAARSPTSPKTRSAGSAAVRHPRSVLERVQSGGG